MNKTLVHSFIVGLLVVLVGSATTIILAKGAEPSNPPPPRMPAGTSFTYQGSLFDGEDPADGEYDFSFSLYDSPSNGFQVGTALTQTGVTVSDGIFGVQLDFGPVFDGNALWLAIAVRGPEETAYTSLGRQTLTAAPMALYASTAPWSGLEGVPAGLDDGDNVNDTVSWDEVNALVGSGANQLAPGIHSHLGTDITGAVPNATLAISATQAPWSGLTGVPAGLDDGDDDTVYTAGAGITLAGTEFSLVTSGDTYHEFWHGSATIPTIGARDWEAFTLDGVEYLAAARFRQEDGWYTSESIIFRWDGVGFSRVQGIPTSGALDLEFFTIGDDSFLATANFFDGSSHAIDSTIFRWDDAGFVEFQSIPTIGATSWEAFAIENTPYLAVTNGEGAGIDSRILRWDGSLFTETQTIQTNNAFGIEAFEIDEIPYLAVANHYDSSLLTDSKIYRWNGTIFTESQTIPTRGAMDWESFMVGSDHYLVVANFQEGNLDYTVDSVIYRWNGVAFEEFQSITTYGARDWEAMTIDDEVLLAVANEHGRSEVYHWTGSRFELAFSVDTDSAQDWKGFFMDSEPFLAVANLISGETGYTTDSRVYHLAETRSWSRDRWDLIHTLGSVGVRTDEPASALQVKGYVQLDTLTAAPPAGDCDEALERGRMKVDIVNDLLYICTNSGWVAK